VKADDRSFEVCSSVWLELTWLKPIYPDPRESVAEMRRRAAEGKERRERWAEQMAREGRTIWQVTEEINQRFGMPKLRRQMEATGRLPSLGTWNWYDARFMIAECLGAPPPEWDDQTHSWWQERTHYMDTVRSVADVRAIPIPDWPRTKPVARMLASHARWMEAFPDDGGGWGITYYLTLPGGGAVKSINYPAFVDLGLFLMGATRFLEILGGDREMADALMDKCFELSTSYTEFILSLKEESFDALCGFGGDVTCMLSPRLFDRYGASWDARLFEYVQKVHHAPADIPCNYHSCGPSVHLYEKWGRHPHRQNITTLQTRLMPGTVRKLRENMPDTYLELTIHPQHFDLAEQPPERVAAVLWETARDAGFHDLHITLIAVAHEPKQLDRLETSLCVCRDTLTEINEYIAEGAMALERSGPCFEPG